MKNRPYWSLAFLLATLAPLTGCETKGPAESAGERIDAAADDAQDAIDPRGPAEKAGDAVDDAIDR